MISFLLCLALLIIGYFVYGKIVDNTFGPDDRETPAVRINCLLYTSASAVENKVVLEHQIFQELMKQERMKAARRPLLMQAKDFHWTFVEEGVKLSFYLPAGSYATALVRELVNIKEEE